jgi:glycosyltransferase involved in cell wall biosynthesis
MLRRHGHGVTLVEPQLEMSPAIPASASAWLAEGFPSIPVSAARLVAPHEHFPTDRSLATARRLSELLGAFDAAWFFEQHWAMPALRERRFRDRLLPLIVLDREPDPEPIPISLEEINRGPSAQYSRKWADLICGGADRGEDAAGAELEQSVIRIAEFWRQRCAAPERAIRRPATSPAVTVCIPYYEAPSLLPETLRSLELQTSQDFTVVAVDDGSFTEAGRRGFDVCAERYAHKGWKFVRQPNRYPGAARNRAAREAASEFLLFLDSDDIAIPTMVERFLRAALLTGDDCLVAPNYCFRDGPEGPFPLVFDPPGNSLVGSMADDMHGGSCIFARRDAFLSIGGFTEIRDIGFEDYEFHVRCNLEGLRWDVLPEPVYRYRLPKPGSVSRSTPGYPNLARVRRWYEERLTGSGLEQLPLAFAASYQRHQAAVDLAKNLGETIAGRLPKLPPASLPPAKRRPRLLMLVSDFPFGSSSGWNRRAQETIRYFGSRYHLTLVTPREAEGRGNRRDAFRHVHALREVDWTDKCVSEDKDLPARVRARYLETIRDAILALPTRQYHAALIDTLFMAEFRHEIDTFSVLLEQNIESRLLRQATAYQGKGPLPKAFLGADAEAERLENYENRTWPDFPLRSVVSEVDRIQMDRRAKAGKTVVAPNGADLSAWLHNVRHDEGTVLFPAHLGYLPNVDAVEFLLSEVWPEVRKRKPRARMIIAGRDPTDTVREAIAKAPGVELRANPKSMDAVARLACVTVVPLRFGSGTRLKILESMAWGLPVVSTTAGCEGIEAEDGEHLLIRDDPREFADATVRLLTDSDLWGKLRIRGRELIRERYSWDRVFDPLDEALGELLSSGVQKRPARY